MAMSYLFEEEFSIDLNVSSFFLLVYLSCFKKKMFEDFGSEDN